jgi:hypothetical protein
MLLDLNRMLQRGELRQLEQAVEVAAPVTADRTA